MSADPHHRNSPHDLHALTEELARRIYGPASACSPLPGFEGGYAVWMEQFGHDLESAVFAATFKPFEHPEADFFRLTGEIDITEAWDDAESIEKNEGPPEPRPVGAFSIPDDLYVYWFDGLWYNMFVLMSPNACQAFSAYHEWDPEETAKQARDIQQNGIVDSASPTSVPWTPPGGDPPSSWSKTGKRVTMKDLQAFALE